MNMPVQKKRKSGRAGGSPSETYVNPVYRFSFPDPFVLKFRGEYYAYCTGIWSDGNVFGVLRSPDLVHWSEAGGAMQRLDNDAPFYWAPEVTYANGRFYLYYSVGNEALMELRVAVSDQPAGGFVDSGVVLTNEEFAIDAHLFIDDGGEKYLFYATDFLDHSHIGTGTVVDRMENFFKLAGNPRPVTRPRYDWQLYDPNRKEKGGVRWHTVEGSFVLKRKGIYYQMFSGGNWQNISYGVSFAKTDDIARNGEWEQFSDGEKVLPILRTVPDLIVGPGHNSVVRGLNNRELYCVYHRWTSEGRVLAIDRMDFAGERMFVVGASNTPQPAPYKPAVVDFFDGRSLAENWQASGEWVTGNSEVVNKFIEHSDGEVIEKPLEQHELICRKESNSFLSEFTFRVNEAHNVKSCFGFFLLNDSEKTFEFLMFPNLLKAITLNFEDGTFEKQTFDLPADFDFRAFHLLRVETDQLVLRVTIDDVILKLEKITGKPSRRIAFIAENMEAAFSAFSLTEGFEDNFEWDAAETAVRGWQISDRDSGIRVEKGELTFIDKSNNGSCLIKGTASAEFVLSANYRLVESYDDGAEFGFAVLGEDEQIDSRFVFVRDRGASFLKNKQTQEQFALPPNFLVTDYHQFSFLKSGNRIHLRMENEDLGEFAVRDAKLKVAFFSQCAAVGLEMVRLTILGA